jgi:hypothetical protein
MLGAAIAVAAGVPATPGAATGPLVVDAAAVVDVAFAFSARKDFFRTRFDIR